MEIILQKLAHFAAEAKYEDLPSGVVYEAKRILLDSVGCALSSLSTDKGKMSVELANRLGGPAESSIIGTSHKVSISNAALANGELINATDFCAVIPPGHIPTNVIPAPLAVAESKRTSGKDLILATVVGFEVAARVASALPFFLSFEGDEGQDFKWAQRWGNSFCNFGAAAATAKILKLDENKMAHTLGNAGHLSEVPTQARFSFGATRPLIKYGSPGWQSTGAIMAALLAEMGYTGDASIFDAEQGFWKFSGYEYWRPDKIIESFGKTWYTPLVSYKAYPCCGMLLTTVDCFIDIINQNNLMPDDIQSVKSFCHPTIELPAFQNQDLITIADAQFNPYYVLGVVAHRIPVGVEWMDRDTMMNPKILEFMKKVSFQVYPEYGKQHIKYPGSSIAKVEVIAKGKTFSKERIYAKGSPVADARMTDNELIEKFGHNASRILTRDKIDAAIKALLNLEKLTDIFEMMKLLSL
jgi:2-methylcitrate dehydratase PrpD